MRSSTAGEAHQALAGFHEPVSAWFTRAFGVPTPAQEVAWPPILAGETTLILAPTGSGKTLAAFLAAIDRLMFSPLSPKDERCRVLYVSPLKALAVDVERNLRVPLAGVAALAARSDARFHVPEVAIRTGDTPGRERARFARRPSDILITTPESLFLILTSAARETLRSVETVIIDEIHTMVATKRGAHLALSLERLEELVTEDRRGARLQRVGLSATVHPVEEAARFLGGFSSLLIADCRLMIEAKPPSPNQQSAISNQQSRERSVVIADARAPKRLELTVEMPLEELATTDDRAGLISPPSPLPDTIRLANAARSSPEGTRPDSPESRRADLLGNPAGSRPEGSPTGLANRIETGRGQGGEVNPITAIYPRILDLIRAHRSTLIFANSRRLAERMAGALNELAGEEIVRAHHGSLAREQRLVIEEELKAGRLPALVATSSLELGIDMGAIDLVIQVETPPSVASGLQRIGRAGHHVDAPSKGVILPKYRGDLLACAALTERMQSGAVEAIHFLRNPLDVLAQQIVAMVAIDDWSVDDLERVLRRAAPFAELPRSLFEGVLDMLSGRYPSADFAELRPRLTWDRVEGTLYPRDGARRVAIANSGAIPDRGLYGVFMVGPEMARPMRVGELDEEMVFESRVGDVFVLGASSWRIEEITYDRVLVSPAPGRPGRMPFWHGDNASRPIEFGRAIGALARTLRELPRAEATALLTTRHSLTEDAAGSLLQYLDDQVAAVGAVPDDETILVERNIDEMGDWRVCILSPFGARVHAPWAMAIGALCRERMNQEADILWTDDGIVVRLPEEGSRRALARAAASDSGGMGDAPPPAEDPHLITGGQWGEGCPKGGDPLPPFLIPDPDAVEALVTQQLRVGGGGARHLGLGAPATALFASRFREAAARALLLPRRRPGQRLPLWQQRKRAADLLHATARFGTFPIVLEAFRECMRDVFDMPALATLLNDIRQRQVRVVTVTTRVPSPFAASLLFHYVANFMYEGDAPLAERRAQALAVDPTRLRELLGEVALRELLDADALAELEAHLQHRTPERRARHADALHDMLLRLGALTRAEIEERCDARPDVVDAWIADLEAARRIVPLALGGWTRYAAVEDVARYRDATGVAVPVALPEALLEPAEDPLGDLLARYARTHGPFTANDAAAALGCGVAPVRSGLAALEQSGRVVQGEFRPGGRGLEWCDPAVLAALRQKSLARLRREVEPLAPDALGRLYIEWQGIARRRRGPDALLEVIEQLQGYPMPAVDLESRILPARLDAYDPRDLDLLTTSGAVLWVGCGRPVTDRENERTRERGNDRRSLVPSFSPSLLHSRVCLFRAEHAALYLDEVTIPEGPRDALHDRIREHLASGGASFFAQIAQACEGTVPAKVLETLWDLVWAGEVTNDTLQPLRARLLPRRPTRPAAGVARRVRAQFVLPPEATGRWSLVRRLIVSAPSPAFSPPGANGGDRRSAPGWRVAPGAGEWILAPPFLERLAARAELLLDRYGVLTREAVAAEGREGGFGAVYPVLRAMEEAGQIRRGYFVAGLGATQFALPAAVDRLRTLREPPPAPRTVLLTATDPANPYGAALPWPERPDGRRPSRSAGAIVLLLDGALAAWMGRGERNLLTFPEAVLHCDEETLSAAIACALAAEVESGHRSAVFIREVNGEPATRTPMGRALLAAGFVYGPQGYMKRA